jgi:nickel-dependent lactate racemase
MKEDTMTKREFILQYVLNRSQTVINGFDGEGSAKAADRAWKMIETLAPQPPPSPQQQEMK